MGFNPDQLKNQFDKLFGAGAYNAGLQNAQKAATLKTQASFAKKDFLTRFNDFQKKKKRDEEYLTKYGMTYDEYQANKADIQKKQKEADKVLKQQEKAQAQGRGGYQPTAENQQKEDAKTNSATSDYSSMTPHNQYLQDQKKKQQTQQPQQTNNQSLWNKIKNSEVGRAVTAAEQWVNPFDNVSQEQAVNNYLNHKQSDTFQEVARSANRAVDSASLGIMSNLDKKLNNRDPYYNSERSIGQGGGTDMITSGLGYLVPGIGATKLVRGLGLGAKEATGLAKLGQLAKEGAITGGALTGAQTGVNYTINPKDQNLKDNLLNIGLGVGLGAVADPLLYAGTTGVKKGLQSASNQAMKKLLPTNNNVQKALSDLAKSHNADNALPIKNKNAYDNLIPNSSDLTNPNKVSKLIPQTKQQLVIPKVSNSKEIKPLDEVSLLDRASMLENTPRNLPDFSNSKPVVEQPSNVNAYGVETPKDLVQSATPEYWQKRYNDFVQYVKDSGYNENNLSHDAINELWTHFAKPEEPPLSKVVDLAYNGYKEQKPLNANDVWNQLGNRPPVSKNAKKIMGINQIDKMNQSIPTENPVQQTSQISSQPVVSQSDINIHQPTVKPLETSPVQSGEVPKQPNERSFFNTIQNSDKITPELQQKLNEFDKTYVPMSNQELVDTANNYIANDIEKAYQFVKNANKLDPRHIAVGSRLIDELQKTGQYDKALDVADILAKHGTKSGQNVQAFSIYNRLTPEGQLIRAQRIVNKINQNIPDPAKQVKLTEQNVQDISQTADSIQKMTGQQEMTNNVIKIMDNIKNGKTPTDSELETVKTFVSDAKKFIGDVTPKKERSVPKPIKDVRTRDKVVDYMSKAEEAARLRLKQKMNRANSLPVDMFYDLAVIGASKVAKGTVKLADFTEEMVKEFGGNIRPYMNQIYDKAVETFNSQSQSMTSKRLSEVEKITNKALKDKTISEDEANNIREFARQVGQMSGDAKLENSMELQSILQGLERPTFAQKLSSIQTIAQLLNPKTIVRNGIGNEIFYRVERLNKFLGTPIDIAKSKLTGADRTVTFITHNQGQYWKNFMTGAKAGWKGVNPMGLTTAYDLQPQVFRSKWNPLTYLEKTLGATLRSFDYAGYMRAYNSSLGELASLKAVNQGLKGEAKKQAIEQYIREADQNMINLADEYGKYATFQDNTPLAKGLTKVKKVMNKVSTGGLTEDFGLGDMVLKYPKTPANLVMRALEYSPAGFLRSAYLIKDAMKMKNPFASREATLAFTRAITGTAGFSILGYVLANNGILTSAGNSDMDVASLEKNAGKQPNSVNVSALKRFIESGFNINNASSQKGDTYVSYDWAQPISMSIALGTGVNQSIQENQGTLNPIDAVQGAFDSGANTIINQSVLKGLNSFLANYPGRTVSDRIGDAAKGMLGSFIPTGINQIRQLSDNTARTTYSPSFTNEMLNRAKNRIPSVEQSLPPAYDTLGNQRENFQGGSNNLFNVLLNPSFVSQYNPSPEAQYVLDYINKTSDKTAAPRTAPKKLDGKPLTTEQYAQLQKMMGTLSLQGLQKEIPNLQGETDNEKIKKAIDKILMNAGKQARNQIRGK